MTCKEAFAIWMAELQQYATQCEYEGDIATEGDDKTWVLYFEDQYTPAEAFSDYFGSDFDLGW